MTLLVISPDFASHYVPLAVLAGAARASGHRVVVGTGPMLRDRVRADGFEWRELPLGASSNSGVVDPDAGIRRFLDATRVGAIAALELQALDRERDLLWQPESVARRIARIHDELHPDAVLVDHVSFGSTLGMHAVGAPFVTLVPGHPSQLPVGSERYGVPTEWPSALRPDSADVQRLEQIADRVRRAFTDRFNAALSAVAPNARPVDDAFRIHGRRVLFNAVQQVQHPERTRLLPSDHRFVGPLVRSETLPVDLTGWSVPVAGRPQVYVALGTFLSHRDDVLARLAGALRAADVRAAIATGPTPIDRLGSLPTDWIVRPTLPQVAMLRSTAVAVHHGGNNSVQESLAAGVTQIVLPFSTDQFSNAVDLERTCRAVALDPNCDDTAGLASAIGHAVLARRPDPVAPPTTDELVKALFD